MILNRQKRLLSLLKLLGGDLPSLDFQKLLFLYCQETKEIPSMNLSPTGMADFLLHLTLISDI